MRDSNSSRSFLNDRTDVVEMTPREIKKLIVVKKSREKKSISALNQDSRRFSIMKKSQMMAPYKSSNYNSVSQANQRYRMNL